MERKVDMIRLERPEEYYDREEIFGRDVSSVFPKKAENEQNKSDTSKTSTVMEAIGARRFISETELDAIKKSRGATADDGTMAVLKPLVEVLREAKEKKESDFQNMWKQMKQGKNRPLDAEELTFMDKLLDEEANRERQKRLLEEEGLEEYRKALEAAKEASHQEEASSLRSKLQLDPPAAKRVLPAAPSKQNYALKPTIKVKPKHSSSAAGISGLNQTGAGSGSNQQSANQHNAHNSSAVPAAVNKDGATAVNKDGATAVSSSHSATNIHLATQPSAPPVSSNSGGISGTQGILCSDEADEVWQQVAMKRARLLGNDTGISGKAAVPPYRNGGGQNQESVAEVEGVAAEGLAKQWPHVSGTEVSTTLIKHETYKGDTEDDNGQGDEGGLAGLLGGYASNGEEEA
ncbi:hypothetical protein CEUSTIGMA_g10117.t1 [Chlamydomonas eustigma]|uniref:FAM192A/Fyv6 N-terminal domain-containing protein n=1 Tax=Chlamydomonas eustigma TaxID=1157962 RepID=A0A250XHY7_9CHLO|nr:hypothetical protein CEUSTIGMA_g10117.t1 [Chlamydomonas eustigma]|eukprot:GAX82691.1 hypothetical protein CEUSTIGMA_g10117.t1 [Chlamydomonas eustigma]